MMGYKLVLYLAPIFAVLIPFDLSGQFKAPIISFVSNEDSDIVNSFKSSTTIIKVDSVKLSDRVYELSTDSTFFEPTILNSGIYIKYIVENSDYFFTFWLNGCVLYEFARNGAINIEITTVEIDDEMHMNIWSSCDNVVGFTSVRIHSK